MRHQAKLRQQPSQISVLLTQNPVALVCAHLGKRQLKVSLAYSPQPAEPMEREDSDCGTHLARYASGKEPQRPHQQRHRGKLGLLAEAYCLQRHLFLNRLAQAPSLNRLPSCCCSNAARAAEAAPAVLINSLKLLILCPSCH